MLVEVFVIEPKLMALPLSVKAPAPFTNDMFVAVRLPMVLVFVRRRLLLKRKLPVVPLVGAALPTQFDPVTQLLLVPLPDHVNVLV